MLTFHILRYIPSKKNILRYIKNIIFFEEVKMVYINKTQGASLAQGILKRPFKSKMCQPIITKNKG